MASYGGHDNIVLATALAGSNLAATAGGNDNEIHLWDAESGKLARALVGVGRAIWSVGFSPDGRAIAWGVERPESGELGNLAFSLKLPTKDSPLGEPKALRAGADGFARAVTETGGLSLQTRASGEFGYFDLLDVVNDGKILATIKRGENAGYAHNAFTFTPDGKTVISGGGHGFLPPMICRDARSASSSATRATSGPLPSPLTGAGFSSGSDDQTVRLWNMATHENVASLFYGKNGEWVLWTPQGYYAASPAGDAHVGWHVNEGEGKLARFVSAAQLKRHFLSA